MYLHDTTGIPDYILDSWILTAVYLSRLPPLPAGEGARPEAPLEGAAGERASPEAPADDAAGGALPEACFHAIWFH